jgi:hypothetical protein
MPGLIERYTKWPRGERRIVLDRIPASLVRMREDA